MSQADNFNKGRNLIEAKLICNVSGEVGLDMFLECW
jgi:hypothetical protein